MILYAWQPREQFRMASNHSWQPREQFRLSSVTWLKQHSVAAPKGRSVAMSL